MFPAKQPTRKVSRNNSKKVVDVGTKVHSAQTKAMAPRIAEQKPNSFF